MARDFSSSRRAPAEERVEAVLFGRLQQDRGLDSVTRAVGLLADETLSNGVGHAGHYERGTNGRDPVVAEPEDLGKVEAGVDVHDGKRESGGREGLVGEMEKDRGVLAAGEQQTRPLHLGGHLANDVHALRLEGQQMTEGATSVGQQALLLLVVAGARRAHQP